MGLRWPPWCEQSSLNSRSNAHCDGAAMAPLCKLVKRGAVRANDLPLSNDLEAWPDSSVGRAPTYKVRVREFESRSGRFFSRTFTFHFFQTLLFLLNTYINSFDHYKHTTFPDIEYSSNDKKHTKNIVNFIKKSLSLQLSILIIICKRT